MDNEFLLQDRLQKIRQIINKYGEENFYQSYSGGKDSTVLSHLLDMAIPGNKIPRVYANTGIEYRLILDFVEREREGASLGTNYLEAEGSYQANVRRGRLSVQIKISLQNISNLSKEWRHRIGQCLYESQRDQKRKKEIHRAFMPQNFDVSVQRRF